MVHQITKGIKISVSTHFDGTVIMKNYILRFVFMYHIVIENNSNDTVQLLSRHWEISDALSAPFVVDGEGVVGDKPVLKSGETYKYTSNCFLKSPFGAMVGYFNMISLSSAKEFRVFVPDFKLYAPFALN